MLQNSFVSRLPFPALPVRILAGALAIVVLGAASPYEFVPAPQVDLNRMYRIDRASGEVGACQYGLKEGTIGVTFCFPPGEGAGKQNAGEYGLVSSQHEREGGVFRVNYRTGEMSVCYVFNEQVVCTPQADSGTTRAGQQNVPAASPTQNVAPAQTANPPATRN